jgi:hypothetical protein
MCQVNMVSGRVNKARLLFAGAILATVHSLKFFDEFALLNLFYRWFILVPNTYPLDTKCLRDENYTPSSFSLRLPLHAPLHARLHPH